MFLKLFFMSAIAVVVVSRFIGWVGAIIAIAFWDVLFLLALNVRDRPTAEE